MATATVAVKGTTQPGATVTIHDANTGGSTSVVAVASGAFAVNVTLAEGPNVMTITSVDQAGNRTTKTLTVVHGSGALKAKLTLSWVTISSKKIGSSPLTITVVVDDAAGKPINVAASAIFTISPPGQPTTVILAHRPQSRRRQLDQDAHGGRPGRRLRHGHRDPGRRPQGHRQRVVHDHEVARFTPASSGSGQPASNSPTGAAPTAIGSFQQGWISSPRSGPLRRSRPHVPPTSVTPRRKCRHVAQVVDERVQTQQRAASACRVPQWGHRQVSTPRV